MGKGGRELALCSHRFYKAEEQVPSQEENPAVALPWQEESGTLKGSPVWCQLKNTGKQVKWHYI